MAVEIARQDLHAFDVRRPAEFRQPLDIRHAAIAGPHLRRDARGQTERKARRAQHGDAVHLTRLRAVRVDEDDAPLDEFVFQRLQTPCPVFARGDGTADIVG